MLWIHVSIEIKAETIGHALMFYDLKLADKAASIALKCGCNHDISVAVGNKELPQLPLVHGQ